MRRALLLTAVLAALLSTGEALASLEPVQRDFGEVHVARLQPAARLAVPVGRNHGRIRVIVRLRSAPLAAREARRLAASGQRSLNVRAPDARRYLAVLAAEQAAAERALQQAIPEATVGRRFRVLLNGLTVELPVGALGRLRSLAVVTRVYPSLRYTQRLNRSPGLIGATTFASLTGTRGDGIKIGVVDDGVDQANPFFDPAGYSFPDGFPRGQKRFTTAKVIVAKSFPAPGTPEKAGRAFDPEASFHGTHVAGIAAGNAGTTAPSGADHPEVSGLTGVAPRAWIGSYRVFSLPTPLGEVANTPEIVAAFEAAVADGMDVINFSGGGGESEPANDALIEVIANVAAAGVVPVIAAGNDRDDFGFGTTGSPGTASEAISVAAVSNSHVFGPPLQVEGFRELPYVPAAGILPPPGWSTTPRDLVDVGAIEGTDGLRVESHLCGPGGDPNGAGSTLPAESLKGAVVLVSRGDCTFTSKARRAQRAGAVGMVVVDNRAGEANPIPVELDFPGMMIADIDGAGLRAYLATRGGRAPMRAGRAPLEFVTGRGGVITSFSSAGPTAFGHLLKPDLAAPGGAILSSTSPGFADSSFAVFDGTSMATPHVAGAAALLVERHPSWIPAQVKSALISTAGPAWANTARTSEAAVTLAGGGLVDVPAADDPRIFVTPTSLSFGDLDITSGSVVSDQIVAVDDAGGGTGEWSIEIRPQSSSAGATINAPEAVTAPGFLRVSARAEAAGEPGDNFGYVILRRGSVARRIPYLFLVTKPGLAGAPVARLRQFEFGTTARGPSRASVYRFPTSPFGHPPKFGIAPPMDEDGGEHVYSISLDEPAINFGVAVEGQDPKARIDPFVLGSLDENDVQGLVGTPVNVNALTDLYALPNGAAGAAFPLVGRYWVSVDSGRDEFTGDRLAGSFVLRTWVDDLVPPSVKLETRRVAAGRPIIAARFLDDGAGVDPLTLVIDYRGVSLGAALYDPVDGLALFPIPGEAPALGQGNARMLLIGSDYQESKNVQTVGTDLYPNTVFDFTSVRVVKGKTVVNWLSPASGSCAEGRTPLVVTADGPRKIRRVRFLDGARTIGVDRTRSAGIFIVNWRAGRVKAGKHRLVAVAVDARGEETRAVRTVRVCK